MEPRELIVAARAAGATLQPEGAFVRATGVAALPAELAAALRQHRDQVHLLLCVEAAVLPDEHDELVRREPEGRPGAPYRPDATDPLRDGLLAGFALYHRPERVARRAGGDRTRAQGVLR